MLGAAFGNITSKGGDYVGQLLALGMSSRYDDATSHASSSLQLVWSQDFLVGLTYDDLDPCKKPKNTTTLIR